MAKLDKKMAKAVDSQESKSYGAIPAGPYIGKLVKVDVSDKPGPSGSHYWTWEFQVAAGEHKNRRLWVTTSLAENALWKLKEVFEALGYETDSDTDEMVGEYAKLIVDTEVQSKGANAGELRNTVVRVLEFDGDPSELEDDDRQPAAAAQY